MNENRLAPDITGEKVQRLNAKARFRLFGGVLVMQLLIQSLYCVLAPRPDQVILTFFIISILCNCLYLYRIFVKQWLQPLRKLNQVAESISNNHSATGQNELSQMAHHLRQLDLQIQEVTHFADHIGKGQFDVQLQHLSVKEGLGMALSNMRQQLQRVAEEEAQRNWVVNGINQLEEILRRNQHSTVSQLSDAFIGQLVRYLRANQGGIYLISDYLVHSSPIELVACYAYDKKKYEERTIQRGQGLVGQCILENESIYMTQVPPNYVRITSGLGEATPRNILLVPIRTQEHTFGVIEMASFYPLQAHQIQFVESVCESFASVITGVQNNVRTQSLLDESRQIAAVLREQEEEMKQNAEELIATQEELARKMLEIQRESILTASIVEAINKTNASIELDMEGNIIAVNDMYLSLMEYTREELLGKPEKFLVAQDELVGERYELMWNSVQAGAFNSGEYRRISKSGRELWLTGTYSPIYDIEGKPYKIIQFAQFTTEQKEKELELSSKIQAINQCIPLLEMSPDCVIITANTFFMNEFGFKRADLRNKPLDTLFDTTFTSSEEFARISQSIHDGQVLTLPLKYKTKTGEDRYFISNFSPSRNLSGQVHKILLALIDTTEQNRLKEQLKQLLTEEKRKNAILELQAETTDEFVDKLGDIVLEIEDNADHDAMDNLLKDKKIPVIEIDQKGIIVFVNHGIAKILGREEVQLLGTNVMEVMQFANPEEHKHFQTRMQTPALSQLKVRFKIKDNELITFSIFLTPRFNYSEQNDFFTILMLMMNVEPHL
jgi:PAS domain S-box-containing protein